MNRNTLAAALLVAAVLSNAARADDAPVTVQIVDAMNKTYGVHPGFRANHAKGVVAEGRFTASAEAAKLTRSPIYSGKTWPVTVRFSDAGGVPNIPDGSPHANPHGLAIKFHLDGGAESDIVVNSLKFFPVATPEDFRDLLLAAATIPAGAQTSPQLDAFLASHPSVAKANATVATPASFADEQYNGIDAFVFVDESGSKQAFRYRIAPEKIVHLDPAEAGKQPPDFLVEDLPRRIAKGPVTFRVEAQLAAPGDPTKDPTQPWPDDRKLVDLGVLTIDKAVADSDAAQKKLLFLPGRLTDGIELSDDPLVPARDGAYAVSFGRRVGK